MPLPRGSRSRDLPKTKTRNILIRIPAKIWRLVGPAAIQVKPDGPTAPAPIDSTRGDHLVATLVSSTSLLSNIIAELGDEVGHLRKTGVVLSAKLRAVSRCLGTDIATISSPDTRELAKTLLLELERIVTWPANPKERLSHDDSLRTLDNVTSGCQDEVKAAAAKYLAEAENFRKNIVGQICDDLVAKLPSESSDGEIQTVEDNILPQMTEELLAAVWTHSVCSSHRATVGSRGHTTRHHPTRLYLGRPRRTWAVAAQFDILISCHSLRYWQEIGLGASLQESNNGTAGKAKQRVKFKDAAPSPPSKLPRNLRVEPLSDFCGLLGRRNCARVFLELGNQRLFEDDDVQQLHHDATRGEGIPLARVLQEYHLSVPDRVVLSHTIAQAFWQLYDTKMMLARWTSQNIWFMPGSRDPHPSSLPCKAYLSFPFERAEYELEEYSTAGLIHRCPRIFALAVLLLEISLVRPIQTSRLQWDEKNFVGQTNEDYHIAMKQLKELSDESWANYTGKYIYDYAIRECVVGRSFSPSLRGPGSSMNVAERRQVFYENVVSPLQKLAGSYGRDDVADIKKKKKSDLDFSKISPDSTVSTTSAPVDELAVSTFAAFHTGKFVDPEEWLEDLKRISRYIHHIKHNVPANAKVTPIRVAILDSGCNIDAPYFRDDEGLERAGRVMGWKDFVGGSTKKTDSFGHGTLMAMLVIETGMVAELYVARVAENTEKLDGSGRRISEAIRWAGIDCEADIISMSFEVDDDEDHIKLAILDVRKERKDNVIFLASAGNLGPHRDVAFPACHKDVVAIRAADSMGAVASSNPSTDWLGAVSFATFGDNIPLELREHEPEVCKPGSSVATAVAAGIAATMLSYASMLPHILPGDVKEDDLKRLRTAEGMKALFLNKLSTDVGNRIHFVNPVKFFTDNETNILRLYAIRGCLAKIK